MVKELKNKAEKEHRRCSVNYIIDMLYDGNRMDSESRDAMIAVSDSER